VFIYVLCKVPGTRNNHCFIPVNNEQLKIFRVSSDNVGTLTGTTQCHNETARHDASFYLPGKYVAAVYDQAWYAGNIVQFDQQTQDVLVNFMTTTRTHGAFQWPRKRDECWVPTEHILSSLPAPSTTSTGRQYNFDESTITNTELLFQQFAATHFS